MMSVNHSYFEDSGVGDIAGRGWRLYRWNFASVILYSLIPTVFITIGQALIQTLSGFQEDSQAMFKAFMCVCPTALVMFLVGFVTSLLFVFFLFKAFHNIVAGKESSYKDVFSFFKENLSTTGLLAGLIAIEFCVFMFFDMIVLLIFYAALVLAIVGIAALASISSFASGVVVSIFVLILLLMIVILPTILWWQALLCGIQISGVLADALPIKVSFKNSFKLLFRHFWRSILFSFNVYAIWGFLNFYFYVPIIFYMSAETYYSGSKTVAVHVLIIMTVWEQLVKMLLWPFLVGSFVLFYEDIRMRDDGVDLLAYVHSEKLKLSVA